MLIMIWFTPVTVTKKICKCQIGHFYARKLGALIWLVPEDINEVRSRLILSFVGSLMAVSENKQKLHPDEIAFYYVYYHYFICLTL